jgi:hypothetical protein
MSTPKNRITRSVAVNSLFASALKVISAAVSFNQGDLLVFDDTANLLKVPTAEAEGATFLGIAPVTVVSGKLKYPYTTDVDASSAIADVPGPVFGVVAKMLLKVGDVFAPGDAVYLSPADGAQVVSSAGTKSIGVFVGAGVTAVAGSEGEVRIGCRHPGDTLKI